MRCTQPPDMKGICPLTCRIVREAVRAFDACGQPMAEYIDLSKRGNTYCQTCRRNEHSRLPEEMRDHDREN